MTTVVIYGYVVKRTETPGLSENLQAMDLSAVITSVALACICVERPIVKFYQKPCSIRYRNSCHSVLIDCWLATIDFV